MQLVFRDIWEMSLWQQYRRNHRASVSSGDETYLVLLDNHIHAYHSLKKSEVSMLEPRAQILNAIGIICTKFLSDKGAGRMAAKRGDPKSLWKTVPDPKSPTGTTLVKPEGVSSGVRGIGTHTVYDNEMTHKVYSLMRRAKLKADYLRALRKMYGDPSSLTVGNPTEFVKTLVSPQSQQGGCSLSLGVQMEFADPAHRDFEVGATSHAGYLLETWVRAIGSGKTTLPFFLWLEEDPSSTRKGEAKALGMGHVQYLSAQERASYLLTFQGGYVDGVHFGKKFEKSGHFNTTALTGDDSYWLGFAAFVVSSANEWFAFQHQPGVMHHSSPMAGDVVRTAGMIKVESGKVTAISNKSGHYRPSATSLLPAVEFLQQQGVLSATFRVHVIDENTARIGHPTAMSLQDYLRKYKFAGARPTLNSNQNVARIGTNRTLLVQ